MDTYPSETFEQNLLPEFPNYHICEGGDLYRQDLHSKKRVWKRKSKNTECPNKIAYNLTHKSGSIKRVLAAVLILIANKRDYDEEKLIIFKDNDPTNLKNDNIFQPNTKDRYLIKYPLETFAENLNSMCEGYSITTDGRLFTRKNKGNSKLENYWMEAKAHVGQEGRDVYAIVKNGRPATAFAHVLVAHAFIGPRPDGLIVCHNDGNAKNNKVDNLRYDTYKSNSLDRIKHGTMLYGEACPNSNLKDEEIKSIIKEFIETDITAREIAQKYDISYSGLNHVLRRRTRNHIFLTEDELKTIDLKLSMWGKKLKREQIIEIFKATKEGSSIKSLADLYGVHYHLIYLIIKRKIWKNVEIPREFI